MKIDAPEITISKSLALKGIVLTVLLTTIIVGSLTGFICWYEYSKACPTSEITEITLLNFDVWVVHDLNETPYNQMLSYTYYNECFTLSIAVVADEDFNVSFAYCYEAKCITDTNEHYRFISGFTSYSDKIHLDKVDLNRVFYVIYMELLFDFPDETELSDAFRISYYFDD